MSWGPVYTLRVRLAFAAAVLLVSLAPTAAPGEFSTVVDLAGSGEAVATVRARCVRCDWGRLSSEAVTLRLAIDDRYSQHIVLARGDVTADYIVTIGTLAAGRHRLTLATDAALSAPRVEVSIESAVVATIAPGSDAFTAQSMAPILHARPNTIGKFTDVPLLSWYEIVPTARGRQFRYSVIFSNEDGGTATDRLMATWGRTTDIEFVYGAEVDARGAVLAEEFQGPGHQVPTFKGRHEGRHPLLFVSTDNNMVSESGSSTVRYAPAPVFADLTNASREVVMDRAPWTYAVTALEMIREGKIGADDAAPRSGRIPDLRRYIHVEACTDLENAAVAFSVRAAAESGASQWFDSDRGDPAFRIVRSGCFRGAVPVPRSVQRVEAIRFRAYKRPPKDAGPGPASVRLTRVNAVFGLDERFQPMRSLFSWTGSVPLDVDGGWRELPF
jgi:hypothetical protein